MKTFSGLLITSEHAHSTLKTMNFLGFIVGFAFSPWVSVCVFVSPTHAGVSIYLTHAWVRETNTHTETVCVFVSRTHAGVSIYLTHAWVRETNTHTETQGENAKPTINPGSQLHVDVCSTNLST